MLNNDSVKLPEVMVFAGPNGSGKSTITCMAKIVGEYINADDIKATILKLDAGRKTGIYYTLRKESRGPGS